jgi:hypothetical protein
MRIDCFDGKEIEYLQEILDSGRLSGQSSGFQGRLEKAFAEAFGVKHAIADCKWLQARAIRECSGNSPCIFSCLYRGDERGISLDDFKQALFDTGENFNIGFTQVPAYKYKLFTQPMAYQNKGCQLHGCPYYRGSYEYRDGLSPTAEEILPRLVNINYMVDHAHAGHIAEALAGASAKAEGN